MVAGMSELDGGGPAFPTLEPRGYRDWQGMTLRTYAAIKLCVPESGIDWLDDMIRQSQRDRLAFAFNAGVSPNAEGAYRLADAMIAARKGGAA